MTKAKATDIEKPAVKKKRRVVKKRKARKATKRRVVKKRKASKRRKSTAARAKPLAGFIHGLHKVVAAQVKRIDVLHKQIVSFGKRLG